MSHVFEVGPGKAYCLVGPGKAFCVMGGPVGPIDWLPHVVLTGFVIVVVVGRVETWSLSSSVGLSSGSLSSSAGLSSGCGVVGRRWSLRCLLHFHLGCFSRARSLPLEMGLQKPHKSRCVGFYCVELDLLFEIFPGGVARVDALGVPQDVSRELLYLFMLIGLVHLLGRQVEHDDVPQIFFLAVLVPLGTG